LTLKTNVRLRFRVPIFSWPLKPADRENQSKKLSGEVMIQAAKLYVCSKDSDTILLSRLRAGGSQYDMPLTHFGSRLLWSLQGYNLER
jgi:hypothetical protein